VYICAGDSKKNAPVPKIERSAGPVRVVLFTTAPATIISNTICGFIQSNISKKY
jgi:hypothetical protein